MDMMQRHTGTQNSHTHRIKGKTDFRKDDDVSCLEGDDIQLYFQGNDFNYAYQNITFET